MLPQVLHHFDLSECYKALQSQKLQLIEPWTAADGMK